jgi:hypothetical protein
LEIFDTWVPARIRLDFMSLIFGDTIRHWISGSK